MTQNLAASDWRAARGDKWCAQLTGMESMLAPVDEPLLRALALDAPARIAEVGSGGGGTTLKILGRAPAGSVVHGFDISPSLVARARERVPPDERSVVFDVADMAIARPDHPYDRLASRFGVMFFDEPDAAFTNLARWLAPGGRFAFAVWGPPSENLWFSSVREAIAQVIDLPKADPNAPGPFRYADADTLLALLARAGLTELDVVAWRGALPIGGGLAPVDAVEFALSAFSSFGELLSAAGDEALNDGRRSLAAHFAHHTEGGSVRLDAFVRIFTGARR